MAIATPTAAATTPDAATNCRRHEARRQTREWSERLLLCINNTSATYVLRSVSIPTDIPTKGAWVSTDGIALAPGPFLPPHLGQFLPTGLKAQLGCR